MTRDEFIQECEQLRPGLRSEPDFSVVCFLISMRDLLTICRTKKRVTIPREVLFDALAELIPSQREFWLRCEATDRERFIGGMTYLFTEPVKENP